MSRATSESVARWAAGILGIEVTRCVVCLVLWIHWPPGELDWTCPSCARPHRWEPPGADL